MVVIILCTGRNSNGYNWFLSFLEYFQNSSWNWNISTAFNKFYLWALMNIRMFVCTLLGNNCFKNVVRWCKKLSVKAKGFVSHIWKRLVFMDLGKELQCYHVMLSYTCDRALILLWMNVCRSICSLKFQVQSYIVARASFIHLLTCMCMTVWEL